MKRNIFFLMLMTLVIILSACGEEAKQVCRECEESCSKDANFCQHCGAELSDDLEEKEYEILDSGQCNENVSWEIRSDGTLYIGGRGAVPSYNSRNDSRGSISPWRASALVSEITDVVIGDEITGLGENLFYGLVLDTLYLGQNVRVFEHDFHYFYAEKIYVPKYFKDICPLLWEASAEKERDYPMTVYYEGTEEEWNQAVSGRSHDFKDVTICFNYNYND